MSEAIRNTKQRADSAIAKINKWHSEINGVDERELNLNELTKELIDYNDFQNGFFPWQTERGNIQLRTQTVQIILNELCFRQLFGGKVSRRDVDAVSAVC